MIFFSLSNYRLLISPYRLLISRCRPLISNAVGRAMKEPDQPKVAPIELVLSRLSYCSLHNKRVDKLTYMHFNPVVRGLVVNPEDWKWSSYRYYERDEVGPVMISGMG